MAPRGKRNVATRKKLRGGNNQSIASIVHKIIRNEAENKLIDDTISLTNGTTPGISSLSQVIIQGTGGAQRIGDNIRWKALNYCFRIETNTLTTNSCVVRVLIVLDKFNVGVAPTITDVLVTSSIQSVYSTEQVKSKRFTILHDKMYGLSQGGPANVVVQRKHKLDAISFYNGTTNVVGANGKNSIWLWQWSTDNTNPPSFNMEFQLNWTDV